MKTHRKVTYRFNQSIIDAIRDRAMIEDITRSELLAFYIQQGYALMLEEFDESGGKPIPSIRKRSNTIPKTYTLPIEVEQTLSWFSQKLDVKKSHLVMALVIDFERKMAELEQKKLDAQIDELMKLAEEEYHLE